MKLKSWITLSLFSLVVLVGSALSNVAWAGSGVYLLVWTSDRGNDGSQDPDFLAVIDADPSSSTYGKIVNTASLPCIPGANLLDELGIAPGVSSCILNEAHHFSSIITDPVTQHRYLYTGGLISANVFRFDVTDPLNIPTATLVITQNGTTKTCTLPLPFGRPTCP